MLGAFKNFKNSKSATRRAACPTSWVRRWQASSPTKMMTTLMLKVPFLLLPPGHGGDVKIVSKLTKNDFKLFVNFCLPDAAAHFLLICPILPLFMNCPNLTF